MVGEDEEVKTMRFNGNIIILVKLNCYDVIRCFFWTVGMRAGIEAKRIIFGVMR